MICRGLLLCLIYNLTLCNSDVFEEPSSDSLAISRSCTKLLRIRESDFSCNTMEDMEPSTPELEAVDSNQADNEGLFGHEVLWPATILNFKVLNSLLTGPSQPISNCTLKETENENIFSKKRKERHLPLTIPQLRPAKVKAMKKLSVEVYGKPSQRSELRESSESDFEVTNSDSEPSLKEKERVPQPGRALKPSRRRSSILQMKVSESHPSVMGTLPYLALNSKTKATQAKHLLNLRRIIAIVLGEADTVTTHELFYRALLEYDFQELLQSLINPEEWGGKSNRRNMLSTLSKILKAIKLSAAHKKDCADVLAQIAIREEWVKISISKISAEHSDSDSDAVTVDDVPSYEDGMNAVRQGQMTMENLSLSPNSSNRESYSTVLNVIAGCLQWGIQCTRWKLFTTITLSKLSPLIGDGTAQFVFDSKDFKTRRTYRRQAIIITRDVCKTLYLYMTKFRRPYSAAGGSAEQDEPFFTNYEGKALSTSDWNRKLQNFNSIFLNSKCRITATILRSVLDTRATRIARKEDVNVEAIRRSDTHSGKTAEKYYNKVTVREVAKNGAREFAKINKAISYEFSDSE